MQKIDITIVRGKTFSDVIRLATPPTIFKAIQSISQTAPARIVAPGNGVPDGWPVAVTGVRGMTEINSKPNEITGEDYHKTTLIDPNTLDLTELNASSFKAYVSGGYIQYNTPLPLVGYAVRMSIKAAPTPPVLLKCTVGGVSGATLPTKAGTDGGVTWISTTTGTPAKEWVAGATYALNDVIDITELYRATTANGRILIDTTKHTIARVFPASDAALMVFARGSYDMELVSPDAVPIVTEIAYGKVLVLSRSEITI